MHSDTVVTLSLRRWSRRQHARFWLKELAPSGSAAATGLVTAGALLLIVGYENPRALAAAAFIATCGVALPTAVAWNVARRRTPWGFDVVQSESPADSFVAPEPPID